MYKRINFKFFHILSIVSDNGGGKLSVSNDIIINQDGELSEGAVFTIELGENSNG